MKKIIDDVDRIIQKSGLNARKNLQYDFSKTRFELNNLLYDKSNIGYSHRHL